MILPGNVENPSSEDELKKILIDINEYFITSKGRILPMEIRYPGFYDTSNFGNHYIVKHLDRIVAFMGVKTQTIILQHKEELKLFFVGSVYTLPAYRGKGLSMLLLNHISAKYFKNGFDGGMLWTTIHDFYKRLEWENLDNGLFIEASKPIIQSEKNSDEYEFFKPQGNQLEILENLNRNSSYHLKRKNSVYSTIPSPAEASQTIVIADKKDRDPKGYLIYGFVKNKCYIYEIVATTLDFKRLLLSYLIDKFDYNFFYFNLFKDDESIALIKKMFTNFDIHNQELGMFLGPTHIKNKLSKVYISFIDRI